MGWPGWALDHFGDDDGDVVGLGGQAGEPPHVPEQLLGQGWRLLLAIAHDGLAQLLAAVGLILEVQGLSHAVGVEHQKIARQQIDRLPGEDLIGVQPDNHAAGRQRGKLVAPQQQWSLVAGVAVGQLASRPG